MTKIFKFLLDGEKRDELASELSWLNKYIKKYRREILTYISIGVIGILMSFASGISSKHLIDAVQMAARDKIFPAAFVFVIMGLSSLVFSSVNSRVATRINLKITNEIREDIFSSVINARWERINNRHAGDILNRFTYDITSVVRFIINIVPGFCTRLVQFIGAFIIICYYDTVMAFIALAGAPIIVFSSKIFIKNMRSYNKKSKKTGSELFTFVEESTQNITFIKAFSLNGYFFAQFRSLLEKLKTSMLEFNRFSIYASAVISLIGLLVSYASYGWGVYRLWNAAITYGTMMLFLQLSANLTNAFSALTALIPDGISASTSAGRLKELADMPQEKISEIFYDGGEKLPGIRFENLSFFYENGTKVLENASFEVFPGEVVAVVGSSGSGKTTILRIILGLVRPASGKACLVFDGESCELTPETRYKLSYVSQDNMLFSCSIAENLRLVAPAASDEEIENVLRLACADFVFDLPNGINTVVKYNGKDFSRGQVQRISIARALIADATVLLFDEATSSLDAETEKKIIENIFNARLNKTCILTSHKKSMVDICDRVFRVENYEVKDVKGL